MRVIMPKSEGSVAVRKPKSYNQYYKRDWEKIPVFKGWLCSVPENRNKAFCKYCKKEFRAHRTDLRTHARSRKHQKAGDLYYSEALSVLSKEEVEKVALKEGRGELRKACKEEQPSSSTDNNEEQSEADPEVVEMLEVLDVTTTSQISEIGKVLEKKGNTPKGDELPEKRVARSRKQALMPNKKPVPILPSIPGVFNAGTASGVLGPNWKQVQAASGSQSKIALSIMSLQMAGKGSVGCKIEAPDPKGSSSKTVESSAGGVGGITAQVFDLVCGMPVSRLSVTLLKEHGSTWSKVSECLTTEDGRCELLKPQEVSEGRYKVHFEVKKYFTLGLHDPFYPFVEITFDVSNAKERYHVTLLLTPYGFMVYRGR